MNETQTVKSGEDFIISSETRIRDAALTSSRDNAIMIMFSCSLWRSRHEGKVMDTIEAIEGLLPTITRDQFGDLLVNLSRLSR